MLCSDEVSARVAAGLPDSRIIHLSRFFNDLDEPICVQISDGSMERSDHCNYLIVEFLLEKELIIMSLRSFKQRYIAYFQPEFLKHNF